MKTTSFATTAFLTAVTVFASLSWADESHREIATAGSIAVDKSKKADIGNLAKISIQDAISIAKKSVDGNVIEAALEIEDGYLLYEVEIVAEDRTRHEVLVDAGNGAVLKLKQKKPKR